MKRVDRQIATIIDAIKESYRTAGMRNELFDLEDRKEQLNRELAHAEEPPALLHPHMAQAYREQIDELFEALEDERTRLEASDGIRSLVGRIALSPGADGSADLWLEGDLA